MVSPSHKKNEFLRINIAGDIFLGRRVESIAIEKPEKLFESSVVDLFDTSDYNIINLESAITNVGDDHKILKTGPHIKAAPGALKALQCLKIDLVTLANNHILDYGENGLRETTENLKNNNIGFVGAGRNLSEASKTAYHQLGQFKIAVINFTENEWANATELRGGANPMDIVDNSRAIQNAKSNADYVIVIIHGGHENYQYPSPRMVKQYRFYAEQGADCIVCHHAHRISGFENYNGIPIFYGIGNFLFDSNSNLPGWHNGMVVTLILEKNKPITWEIHPYQQCIDEPQIELLKGHKKVEILNEIEKINTIISDSTSLKQAFEKFANDQHDQILSMFSTSNIINLRYLKSAIRKFNLEFIFLRKSQLKSILNFTRCEAHKDVTLHALNNYFKNRKA